MPPQTRHAIVGDGALDAPCARKGAIMAPPVGGAGTAVRR